MRSEMAGIVAASAEQTSGRFEVSIETIGRPDSELPARSGFFTVGSFDTAKSSFDVNMGIITVPDPVDPNSVAPADGFYQAAANVRIIGDQGWVVWSEMNYSLTGGKWVESDADELGSVATESGTLITETPALLFDVLQQVDTEELIEIDPAVGSDVEQVIAVTEFYDHGLDVFILPPPEDEVGTAAELGVDLGDLDIFGIGGLDV